MLATIKPEGKDKKWELIILTHQNFTILKKKIFIFFTGYATILI